jgi:hypothetical protein
MQKALADPNYTVKGIVESRARRRRISSPAATSPNWSPGRPIRPPSMPRSADWHKLMRAHRTRRQAGRRGDQRHHPGRRHGTRAGLPLPRRRRQPEGALRLPRSHARPAARRRRHAARAAPGRHAGGRAAADGRQAHQGRRGAEDRPDPRRGESRRGTHGGAQVAARCRRLRRQAAAALGRKGFRIPGGGRRRPTACRC